MIEIITVGISSVCTVVVAIIGAITAAEQKKNAAYHEEERAARILRERESRLSMSMMDATLQLSIVTANALTGGHNNGNVAAAKSAAENAQKKYNEFLQETTAGAINK